MSSPRFYDFQERLLFSNGHAPSVAAVEKIIRSRVVGCNGVRKATTVGDKSGCDYHAERGNNCSLHIDLKLRDVDWSIKSPQFADDLALETFSVLPENGAAQKPGWTRDESKSTDYVLWFWRDTGRFCLLPFPPLCFVFQERWQEWRETYPHFTQSSGRWKSECVFVPRQIVINDIVRWGNGKVRAATA